ncbi:hypothetical protein EJB05_45192 [Eragrostis curvula]|uniref:Uncharacterized protein n=1 Tax=Eragrostis curvula TaxID=38414 RepID=A0A5J9TKY6_9POAL|nr:hypothetical protein EJB05_45192 [Eragrostis curvula]
MHLPIQIRLAWKVLAFLSRLSRTMNRKKDFAPLHSAERIRKGVAVLDFSFMFLNPFRRPTKACVLMM